MTRAKWIGVAVVAALVVLVGGAVAWRFRWVAVRLAPIHHEGVVYRVGRFNKGGGGVRFEDPTRQRHQFAVVFEDGFNCEGFDTSFAAVEAGDRVEIVGYHDVKGYPVLDPEWWECDEAQLVRIVPD